MGEIIFVLGDILPTYYDVAISIFSVATKPNSAKMNDTINRYANALIEIWVKSFGTNHVMSRRGVVMRLEKLVQLYYTKVYNISNWKSVKNKGGQLPPSSIRSLNKQWKTTSIEFRLAGVFPINSLLDIGKGQKSLKGAEKVFYRDQKTSRLCRLNEEIDQDWVKEQLALLDEQQIMEEQIQEQQIQEVQEEMDHRDEGDIDLDTSVTRFGRARIPKED